MTGAQRRAITCIVLMGSASARAADGRGDSPLPDGGTPLDPRWVWGPGPQLAAFSLGAGYADAPVVREVEGLGTRATEIVLDDVFTVDLGAAWKASERVSLGAVVPLVLASGGTQGGGPALGDLRAWAPVTLFGGEDGAIRVIPSIGLPTGPSGRFLGAGTLTPEISVSGGQLAGRFGAWASAGVRLAPDGASEGAIGRVPAALALGFAPAERFAVLAEGRVTASLVRSGTARQVPAELMLSGRGTSGDGLFWHAGVGRAVLSGVGGAALRVEAGAGWRLGHPAITPIEVVTEVVDAPTLRTVHVRDGLGRPVRGAQVTLDGVALGTTGATGDVEVTGTTALGATIAATRDGYGASAVEVEASIAGERLDLTLPWLDVPVEVRVTGPDGALIAEARIDFPDLGTAPTPRIDDVGTHAYSLPPGYYAVRVSSAGYGTQSRTAIITPGRTETVRIDAVLAPSQPADERLDVTIVTPEGRPIEGAFVTVDGVVLGATSSGGTISLAGLGAGPHRVEIAHEAHEDLSTDGVTSAGTFTLAWKPGTVIVIARSRGEPLPDALVAFDGAARLPPTGLGPEGERAFQLRAGPWTALVSAPMLGAQQRRFEVYEGDGVQVIEVVLGAAEQGPADLFVTVLDPDGVPVDGVDISIDGVSIGRTSNLGSADVLALDTGPLHLEIAADGRRPIEQDLRLVSGPNRADVLLGWLPGSVELTVTGPDGKPTDALIAWTGPAKVPPTKTGASGVARLVLEPGTWTAFISSAEFGSQGRTVQIDPDSEELVRVQARLQGADDDDAGLALRVVDANGAPVEGAEISVDGDVYGRTGAGGDLQLRGRAAGTHQISAAALGMSPVSVSAKLEAGATREAPITLAWAPGAVRVRVGSTTSEPLVDVRLAASGARVLRPAKLDATMTRLLVLEPGEWWLFASASGLASAQQKITVPPTAGLTEIALTLGPMDAEKAEVLVRVIDTNQEPIGDAEVAIDGVAVGRTTPDGSLLLAGRAPGKATIVVRPSAAFASVEKALELEAGPSEHLFVAAWRTFPVEFTVMSLDDAPMDAQIMLAGPEVMPLLRTGADGTERAELRSGVWQAYASVPGGRTAQAPFTVTAGDGAVVQVTLRTARPKNEVAVSRTQVEIHETVQFDVDLATIRSDSDGLVNEVAKAILAHPEIGQIEIQGHTDDLGSVEHNLDLSQRRAETVRDVLIARGVPPERLIARGYGMLRPVVVGKDEASRALNRRVQFVIVETQAP